MITLNHTIVFSKEKTEGANFLTDLLGLPRATPVGKFMAVELTNGVTLDYSDTNRPIATQHYAFQLSDDEFDRAFERIKQRNIAYWADPFHQREDIIYASDRGRGLYFEDPSGHNMEILTRARAST
jgi:catechol 2,3-dioxygenase-like lactoylglutathione lyase family enzyme